MNAVRGRTAVRGRLLILDPPVPRFLLQKAAIEYTTTDTEVTWEEGEDGKKRREKNLIRSVDVLEAYVRFVDGRVAFPRWTFSDHDLASFGYEVIDVSENPIPRHPELVEAKKVSLREHQVSPYAHALHDGRGVLQLGTGRGKTVLALAIIRSFAQPALIFVDTQDLMHQWIERIEEHLGIPASRVGTLAKSIDDWTWEGYPITVALVQSWRTQLASAKVPPAIFDAFGTVIFDELHAFSGEHSGTSTLGLFSGRRFGLTATPHTDGRESIYFGHIGRVIYKDLATEHIPTVFFHPLPTATPNPGGRDYTKVASSLLGSSKKAPDPAYVEGLAALLRDLQKRGRTVLAITPRKRVGHVLAKMLADTTVIDADVKGDRRLKELHAHSIVIVINTLGEKALDRADVDAVVYLIPPGQDAISRIQQGAGRGLRRFRDKTDAELHFAYADNPNGLRQARATATNCAQLGFTIADGPARAAKIPQRQGLPPAFVNLQKRIKK